MESTATPGVRIASVKSCVLYDASGEIQHTHTVVTIEGGQQTSDADLVARTRELAADRGLAAEQLQPLQVDPAALKSTRLRVDPATRTLVEQS